MYLKIPLATTNNQFVINYEVAYYAKDVSNNRALVSLIIFL